MLSGFEARPNESALGAARMDTRYLRRTIAPMFLATALVSCGGRGGGGYGGGSSYALYLISASPVIEGNALNTVGGVDGGDGGHGGQGGVPGTGGTSNDNSGAGDRGGRAGGSSYAICKGTLNGVASSPTILGGNTYAPGPDGSGGTGGAPGEIGSIGYGNPDLQRGGPGKDGYSGTSATIGS